MASVKRKTRRGRVLFSLCAVRLFFLLLPFALYGGGQEKILPVYEKNTAVTPDGALVEPVWDAIPPESGFVLLQNGAKPRFGTRVKAVFELDYICFAFEFDCDRCRVWPEREDGKRVRGRRYIDHIDALRVSVESVQEPGLRGEALLTPCGVLDRSGFSGAPSAGVKILRNRFFAELRIPVLRERFYYRRGQRFKVRFERRNIMREGGFEVSCFAGTLVLRGPPKLEEDDRDPRKWRNGDFSTFFKRPNRKWNPNWDLGEGDNLEQGWNLNLAKGRGYFEVLPHPEKKNDYYVLLKNGDFYQTYKGSERNLLCTFRAKGKGTLRVRFLRFKKGRYPRLLETVDFMKLELDSMEWKTFSGRFEKKSDDENLALSFAAEHAEIMLDDAFVQGRAE